MNNETHTWLVTGVAGFIGSHLARHLIADGHTIVGLDSFCIGHKKNLQKIEQSSRFTLIEGDIRHMETCVEASNGADYILHHAAIGSVQKSLENPSYVDSVNNSGFINILNAAKHNSVKRVVYASSSAVYGNEKHLEKRAETETMSPLSPYAASKCANELYAETYSATLGVESIGLRYFNIFGPNQDPNGAYAAVIPKWIDAMLKDQDILIFGDGQNIRDFCFVGDVVQANINAAKCSYPKEGSVFNIATGNSISLNELFDMLKSITGYSKSAIYKPPRAGDIVRSKANIQKAVSELNFQAKVKIKQGLQETVEWYKAQRNA